MHDVHAGHGRGVFIQILESAYRFTLGAIAGGKSSLFVVICMMRVIGLFFCYATKVFLVCGCVKTKKVKIL